MQSRSIFKFASALCNPPAKLCAVRMTNLSEPSQIVTPEFSCTRTSHLQQFHDAMRRIVDANFWECTSKHGGLCDAHYEFNPRCSASRSYRRTSSSCGTYVQPSRRGWPS